MIGNSLRAKITELTSECEGTVEALCGLAGTGVKGKSCFKVSPDLNED